MKGPNPRPRFDIGPDFASGIISKTLPIELTDSYRVLVPQSMPTAMRRAASVCRRSRCRLHLDGLGGAQRQRRRGRRALLSRWLIGTVPTTKAEREARHDPRPSLEERYRDAADYAAKVQEAASALAQESYLLPEDVERIALKANSIAW